MKQESNPFLGERGVRLYMSQQDLFVTQLRSIFRAAKPDLIRVMFPMVSDRDELRKIRDIFNDIRENMSAPKVELGIMIEVPSSAVNASQFAKHVDFFNRYLNEVMQNTGDLSRYHSESYKIIFYKELPDAMSRLIKDSSPMALAEAAVTYNLVVEGILAETGYNGWFEILQQAGILSGMSKGIELVQRDESRHLRFGVYLISRLIVEHGDLIWEAVQKRMEILLPPAINIINELFDYQERLYGKVAFGIKREDFVDYAVLQFQKRIDRIEKARTKTIDEILFKNIIDEI